MVVELFLINVGRESATNIGLVPMREGKYNNQIYFDVDFVTNDTPTHGVYEYFSEYFTMPGDSISLKISENLTNKQKLYFINFKIQFQDLINRVYEQEFKFGYDNQFVNGINKHFTVYPPKLIKDVEKEKN